MNVNDKIIFRTCGRGVMRVWKGTIQAIVNRGKLAPKEMRLRLPHGDEASNRPRYVVLLNKSDTLMWANATGPNIALQGRKLPTHEPRIYGKPAKAKKSFLAKQVAKAKKAKPVAKVKNPRVKARLKMTPKQKALEGSDPVVKARKGGDKPKTTWYDLVDSKVVSVRKVLCPEGFSAIKPTLPEAPAAAPAPTPEPTTAPPAAEAPSLPQAAAV